MSKGMDMMVQSLIRMLGLDPAIMMEKVEEIRKSLSNAAADMATLRRQQTAMMAHLGISDIAEERHDGDRTELSGNAIQGRGVGTGTDPGR